LENFAVNDNFTFAMRFGILAMCAIIGVYYALIRKRTSRESATE
jgi:hypothetical protein